MGILKDMGILKIEVPRQLTLRLCPGCDGPKPLGKFYCRACSRLLKRLSRKAKIAKTKRAP